jgi:hypothetical protein
MDGIAMRAGRLRVAPLASTDRISHKVALVIVFALFGLMIPSSLGKLSWLRFPGAMTLAS